MSLHGATVEECLRERLISRFDATSGPSAQQLYVAKDSLVVANIAVSTRPGKFDQSSVFAAWCAAKPVLALAVAVAVGRRGGSLETDMADLLPRHLQPVVPATLGALLTHSLALSTPSMFEAMLMPKTSRFLAVQDALTSTNIAQEGQYSEYVWGRAVGEILMHLEAKAPARVVDEFLGSMHLSDGLLFPASSLDRVAASRRCAPVVWSKARLPVVPTESTSTFGFDVAATGGLASARGLGEFYDAIAAIQSGVESSLSVPQELVHRLLSIRRGRRDDRMFRRTCDFAAGFAVGLSDHGYGGAVSDEAYGSSGAFGAMWAFHDPSRRITISYVHNAANEPIELVDARRQSIIDDVLGCVE